jgi:GTPase SAR1 family protein
LAGLQRISRHQPTLADRATEIARARADLDEPLLLTVMGEFSSGKSTFVNAFAGDDVAPTGITPTTATINVVKYGRERGGRLVYRRGTSEELGFERLQDRLRHLDAAAAREVELVEIMLPLPALSRVHIVDTPGLNSILPEHEAVARDFITRADAVVWLFSAGQAGKASERRALEEIREQGVRVLGVLNKIDQLQPKEAEELAGYVEAELGELVEAVLPVSAMRARQAQAEDGQDARWSALASALESRFFVHARELKRQVCARRITEILDRMQIVVSDERERADSASTALRRAHAQLLEAQRSFADEVVAPERRALAESVKGLYGRAAVEVLDLVRPRRLPFGSHTATPADRDYLLALLDAGFDEVLAPTRHRVLERIRDAGAAAIAAASEHREVVGDGAKPAIETAVDDAVRWLDAETFGRARAFVRGFLRGGYVDRFFQRQLPKLELSEEAIHHALLRDSPDLDAALAAPLTTSADVALAGLAEQVARLRGAADAMAFDLEVGLARALEHHRAALARLDV